MRRRCAVSARRGCKIWRTGDGAHLAAWSGLGLRHEGGGRYCCTICIGRNDACVSVCGKLPPGRARFSNTKARLQAPKNDYPNLRQTNRRATHAKTAPCDILCTQYSTDRLCKEAAPARAASGQNINRDTLRRMKRRFAVVRCPWSSSAGGSGELRPRSNDPMQCPSSSAGCSARLQTRTCPRRRRRSREQKECEEWREA